MEPQFGAAWARQEPKSNFERTLFSNFFLSGKKHIDDAWLISIGSWMNFCSCETKTRTLMSSLHVNLHKPRSLATVFWQTMMMSGMKGLRLRHVLCILCHAVFSRPLRIILTRTFVKTSLRELPRIFVGKLRWMSWLSVVVSWAPFPFQDMPRCIAWCCQQQMCGTNSSKQTS